ncbi:g8748 [Coccomyxa elongata]
MIEPKESHRIVGVEVDGWFHSSGADEAALRGEQAVKCYSPGSVIPGGFPEVSPNVRDALGPEGMRFTYAILEATTSKQRITILLKFVQLEKRLRLALNRLREKGYVVDSVTEGLAAELAEVEEMTVMEMAVAGRAAAAMVAAVPVGMALMVSRAMALVTAARPVVRSSAWRDPAAPPAAILAHLGPVEVVSAWLSTTQPLHRLDSAELGDTAKLKRELWSTGKTTAELREALGYTSPPPIPAQIPSMPNAALKEPQLERVAMIKEQQKDSRGKAPATVGPSMELSRENYGQGRKNRLPQELDPDSVIPPPFEGRSSGQPPNVMDANTAAAVPTTGGTQEEPGADDEEKYMPQYTPRAASGRQEVDFWAKPSSSAVSNMQSAEYAASAPRGGHCLTYYQDMEWMEGPPLSVSRWTVEQLEEGKRKGEADRDAAVVELERAVNESDQMRLDVLDAARRAREAWITAMNVELVSRRTAANIGQGSTPSPTAFLVPPLPNPQKSGPDRAAERSTGSRSASASASAPSRMHASTTQAEKEASTKNAPGLTSTGSMGHGDDSDKEVAGGSASTTAAAATGAPGDAINPAAAVGLLPGPAAAAAPPGPVPDPAAATVAAPAPGLFHGLSAKEIQQRLEEIRASNPGLVGLQWYLDAAIDSLTQLEEEINRLKQKTKRSQGQRNKVKKLQEGGPLELKSSLCAEVHEILKRRGVL